MDAIVVKCAGNEMFNHFDQFAIKLVHFWPKRSNSRWYLRVLRCVLAPSSHCSILTEIPLAGKALLGNDLSIARVAKMESAKSTNSRNQLI